MLLAAVTQTTDEGFHIHDILRAVSGALEVPVIVLLVLFLLAAAALVGWLISESCTERRHLKLALPALMETLRTAPDREAAVEESGLLRRQKDALLELLRHPDFTDATREALAIELLERDVHSAHPAGPRGLARIGKGGGVLAIKRIVELDER